MVSLNFIKGESHMESTGPLDENWNVLTSLFPENWKELAKITGAMSRKFRSFTSEEALMRTLLLHIARGYSLRETVVKARMANIANVSDVALLKRLRFAEEWFRALCKELLKDRGFCTNSVDTGHGIRMRLVDATEVKEPGRTGSLWRIHYSIVLPELQCDYFKLTATEGAGTGETFKHLPINKNDCIIGDRGYSNPPGIAHISKHGGYSLVRVNTGFLRFYTMTEKKFNLLAKVKKLKTSGKSCEWRVKIRDGENNFICGRLCAVRKSEEAIKQAIKKMKNKERLRQTEFKLETFEFAKYIIVFTTLPQKNFSTCSILEWYRLRWQIELIFKRLKSLAGLGHLPKYDDTSSKSWLYGKLFIGLLIEKLIRYASEVSPWGYCL
jgi:hypothetical protein